MPRIDLKQFSYDYLRKRGLNRQLCEQAALLPQALAVSVWPSAKVLFEDAYCDEDGRENLASSKAKEIIRASADGLMDILKFRSWKAKWYLIDRLNAFGTSVVQDRKLDDYDLSVEVPVGPPAHRLMFGIDKFVSTFNPSWMTPYHIEPPLLRRAVRDSVNQWFRSDDSYRKAKKLRPLKLPDRIPRPRWVKTAIILSLVLLGLKAAHHLHPDLVPFDIAVYLKCAAEWVWWPFSLVLGAVWDGLVYLYYWALVYIYTPLYQLLN